MACLWRQDNVLHFFGCIAFMQCVHVTLWEIHVVGPEEEKEGYSGKNLQKEGFKPGMKE